MFSRLLLQLLFDSIFRDNTAYKKKTFKVMQTKRTSVTLPKMKELQKF
jgi:hypothetical protein